MLTDFLDFIHRPVFLLKNISETEFRPTQLRAVPISGHQNQHKIGYINQTT
jgi:hypothetical protein